MLTPLRHDRLSPNICAYAESHCRICAAGWTRTGEDGKAVIVCLLDRDPVWQEMTACDRFQPKDKDELDSVRPTSGSGSAK